MIGKQYAWAVASLLALVAFLEPSAQAGRQIATDKHNLSATGPGTVKATSEDQICVFCHAPHNSAPTAPLWNREAIGNIYTPYASSTLKSAPGQPNGASLLCLSCHDGTVALGKVFSRAAEIAMVGGPGAKMPPGDRNLGIDLRDDHPVSFTYASSLPNAELAGAATLTGRVKLDATGRMQCTACHDAHSNEFSKFLVRTNVASAICITCHTRTNWATSDHATKTNTWTGTSTPNPWPRTGGGTVFNYTTVAQNACENCHRPHTAAGAPRILNFLPEEDNCLVCHKAGAMSPAAPNIATELSSKASVHSMVTTLPGVHDPVEPATVVTRHVECADCHNPHQTKGPASLNAAGSNLPLANPLIGVRGVTIAGDAVNPVNFEYQICFRCHADTADKAPPRITRQHVQGNTRLEFQTTNPSFHPIAGPRGRADMPSLISPWTSASTMKCTHCHNNNAGPRLGVVGTGPNGPHGSDYTPILNRQYSTADPAPSTYSDALYELCYQCHSSTSILGNDSFKEHDKHIRGERTPCSTCHDPHGVSGTQGNLTRNASLINFNTSVVTPSGANLYWQDDGVFQGRCYLNCHGKNHSPETY